MKQPTPYLLLALLLCACVACREAGNAQTDTAKGAARAANYKRYAIESAIVEYTVSGAQRGTETLYFDRWGRREAKHSRLEISLAGITQKQNTLTITEGELIYTLNPDQRTGTKTVNPLFKQTLDQAPDKDLAELGLRMLERMGGVKIGAEEVAGKLCEVWEIKNLHTQTWLWKTVPLKTQAQMSGLQITRTATKIEEGVTIPEDRFAIPAGIKLTEGVDVRKALEGLKNSRKN